jgi:hypothetical protein
MNDRISTGYKFCACCQQKKYTRTFRSVGNTELGYLYQRLCRECYTKYQTSGHDELYLICQKCKKRKWGEELTYVVSKKRFYCETCIPKNYLRKLQKEELNAKPKKVNFEEKHKKRFSKVLEIMGFDDSNKSKFLKGDQFNEIQQNAKNLYDKRLQINRNFYSENKDYFRDYDKNYKKVVREKNDKSLNEFYLKNDVPKFLWNESEFKTEHDYQTALQWSIVDKFKHSIQPWLYLEKTFGFPDIYIPKLHLIIEVKLNSVLWERNKIIEQISKYKDFSEVVLVSLDGKPQHWIKGDESEFAKWFNSQELFSFLEEQFGLVYQNNDI